MSAAGFVHCAIILLVVSALWDGACGAEQRSGDSGSAWLMIGSRPWGEGVPSTYCTRLTIGVAACSDVRGSFISISGSRIIFTGYGKEKIKSENRDMTKEEAYMQLGHGASLLKAVLKTLQGQ